MFLPCKKPFLRLQFAPIFVVYYLFVIVVHNLITCTFMAILAQFYVYFCLVVALCYCLVTVFMSDLLYVNYSVIIADIGAFRVISLHFVLFRP